MFEYTALVDAPVQRFTGIVTGSDPDDEVATLQVQAPSAPLSFAVPEAPVALVAAPTAPIEAAEPVVTVEPVAASEPVVPVDIVVPAAPEVQLAPVKPLAPRRDPAPHTSPAASVVPTVLAIAAAGITAMWWFRRDSHDRGR